MAYGNRKCKGSCTQPTWKYKKYIAVDKRQPYIRGYKRCNACEIYLNGDDGLTECPCCFSILRSKPNNVKSRKRFNELVLKVVEY